MFQIIEEKNKKGETVRVVKLQPLPPLVKYSIAGILVLMVVSSLYTAATPDEGTRRMQGIAEQSKRASEDLRACRQGDRAACNR